MPAGTSSTGERRAFLLSLALLGYYEKQQSCASVYVACAMGVWVERASELVSIVTKAQGRRGAVDLLTNCLPEGTKVAPNGVVIRTHPKRDPALVEAVAHAPIEYVQPFARVHSRCLYKWAAMNMLDAEFVCYVDMDMLPLTPKLAQLPRFVAGEWSLLMAQMRARGLRLVSEPDSSSPLNGGWLLFRPDRRLYEEGIRVLEVANANFNTTHGWELRGRPRDVIPKADDAWRAKPKTSQWWLLHRNNDWKFFAAPLDQGFFFYMMRVKFALGADLPLQRPPGYTPRARWCLPHCASKPYGPFTCRGLERWLKWDLAKRWPREMKAAGKRYVYFRDGVETLRAMAHTGETVLPASQVARCTKHWNELLACIHRLAQSLDVLTSVNSSAWETTRATPIDVAFTHRKCHPEVPAEGASLFFGIS